MQGDITTKSSYDEVSDLGYDWCSQRPDFKSALRLVKAVLNNQCYLYLWLPLWFPAKKSTKTKSLISLYKFGSRSQKSPKPVKKKITQLRSAPYFFSKVLCILDGIWWILMSRRFRMCVPKGGRGCLRPSYGRPKLTLVSKKSSILQCCKKNLRNWACPHKKWFAWWGSISKI